jgi:hypothetical protein
MADEPMAPEPDAPDTPLAAPDEGTPAEPDAPQGDGQEPDIDYRKRFEDLQPELTRAQQANAEFRQLFEGLRDRDPEALEVLGWDQEEQQQPGIEDDEFADPDEQLRAELAEIREQLGARDQQEQVNQEEEATTHFMDEQFDQVEKELGFELSDEALGFIVGHAVENPGDDGFPDVPGATREFLKVAKAEYQRYMEAKRNAPKAPVGEPGEEDIDLSDDDSRVKRAVQLMEAEGS